jgi:hypothetical protein
VTGGPGDEEDDLPDFGPDSPAVDAGSRQAYIENLLVVAADDAKNVTLISTVAVGAVAFAAKELAAPLSHEPVILKLLGLLAAAFLLAGAVLFYFYAAAVNHTRMGLVHRIVSRDARGAQRIWAGKETGIWPRKGVLWRFGAIMLVAGSALGCIVTAIVFLT